MLGKCRERQQTLPIHHANLRRPIRVVHESFEVIGANSSLEDGSHQNAFGNVIDVPADGRRAVLPLVIRGSERVAVANYTQKHHDFLDSGHLPRIFQAMCHQALHQRDECFLRHSARMAECVFVPVPEQLAHPHVAGESRSALWNRIILRLGDVIGPGNIGVRLTQSGYIFRRSVLGRNPAKKPAILFLVLNRTHSKHLTKHRSFLPPRGLSLSPPCHQYPQRRLSG